MLVPHVRYNSDMVRSRVKILLAEKATSENRKITYREFAAEAGFSKNIAERWCTNNFSRMDKATINKLCKYFKCQPGALMEQVDD